MRVRIIAATLLALGALLILPITANAETGPNKAVVSFVPSNEPAGFCVESWAFPVVATPSIINTTDSFTVKFTLWQRLCSPIIAKGAVYAMPDYPIAWPQELVSVTEFSIQEKGVYTITFSKLCQAQQFDVVVGATPQTIGPGFGMHGPLLFTPPFFSLESSSALQWWGTECVDDTSVTTATTTTTQPDDTTTTTTTTTQPEDTTTTTTQPDDTTTTTTTGVSTSVLGTVVTRPGDPGDPGVTTTVFVAGISVGQLPVTGTETKMILSVGIILCGAGAVLVSGFRRRSLLK